MSVLAFLGAGSLYMAVAADASGPPASAAIPGAHNGTAKSEFKKISLQDAGFATFHMFGSEAGAAKYLVNDAAKGRYIGLFQLKKPLPENNVWDLTVNEYLTVLEGELKIDFLNTGESFVVHAGEQAYLPVGSRLHLTALKLPYAESFVMTTPQKNE